MIRKLRRSLQNYLNIRTRIFRKIVESKKDPFRFFKKLEGRKDYRLRVGNYRVIADINKNKKRIEITKIGHRKNIYRKNKCFISCIAIEKEKFWKKNKNN